MSEALCPWPSQRDRRAVASSPRSPRCRTELRTHGPRRQRGRQAERTGFSVRTSAPVRERRGLRV